MSWFHLIFGLLLFWIFTVTGQYMRADFPDKSDIDQTFRILMRSRHIYLLLSSLIHIVLGIYLQLRPNVVQRVFQFLGSALLVTSSGLLLWAFEVETYQTQHYTDISRWGLYTSLAGVIGHLIGGLKLPNRSSYETTR
jgi:hypothetical protein